MHKLDEILENYCERIEKELDDLYTKISKSDTMSAQDADLMNKLLHALKSDKTVWAMIEYEDRDDDRYSGRGYSDNGYSGSRYYSGRRSIPSMGTRNYSRDSEREEMIRKLENMMGRVRNDAEAVALRDAIDTVNRMG